MGKVASVPNRQYTDEFKVEAVRLAESIGGNQASKRLGIPDSSIWNWIRIRLSRNGKLKAVVGGAVPMKRSVTELEAEKCSYSCLTATRRGKFVARPAFRVRTKARLFQKQF